MWAALAVIPVAILLMVILAVRDHVKATRAGKGHGTVGLAVRLWAYQQVVSGIVFATVLLVILLAIGVHHARERSRPPAPPAPPRAHRLITNKNWKPIPEEPGDDLETKWYKRRPPADGLAYDENMNLVKVPEGQSTP